MCLKKIRIHISANWYDYLGGFSAVPVTTILIKIIVPAFFISNLLLSIFISLLSAILGVLFAEALYNLWLHRQNRSTAILYRNLIDEARHETKRYGKKQIFNLQLSVLKQFQKYTITDFNNLFKDGMQIDLEIYGDLVDNAFNLLTEEYYNNRIDEITLFTTCILPPHFFHKSGRYESIWYRVWKRIGHLRSRQLRILCNHDRKSIIRSIEEQPFKFEEFCE